MKFILVTTLTLTSLITYAETKSPFFPQAFNSLVQVSNFENISTSKTIEDLDGVPTFERTITVHSMSPKIYTEKLLHLVDKRVIFHNTYKVENENKKIIRSFHYDKEDRLKLIYVDYLNNKEQITKRELNSPLNNEDIIIKYNYDQSSDQSDKALGFKVYSQKTNLLLGTYSHQENFDLEKIYAQDPNRETKIQNIQRKDRIKVALVDSGLDQNHIDLAYKLAVNENDPIDGIDNDGNGEIDDYIGLQSIDQVGLPIESIKPKQEHYPMSHGTHVGHIMVKDVDNVALYPFTGEYGEAPFLKRVSNYIANEKIEFVNMSFGIPNWITQMIPKKSYFELQNLIKVNQDTLFFAAAGNDFGKTVQHGKQGNYPAAFNFENIIVIGAINSDDFKEENVTAYEVADYSNIGTINVDIFAPGTKIKAASLGGGLISHTGTSMATPWLLNLAVKIKNQFPELSHSDIKKALLFSAYIPNIDSPLECTSGGMAFPRRAMAFAKELSLGKSDVKEIVKTLYATPGMLLGEEKASEQYFDKLFTIWTKRLLL
ncbi:peptidase, S8/S53 family [Bacteriovorax sp. BSW11_IV]|uniref:S8 family serine peptidase n=1 Tax=Bacteriovorax sp. BSW11_IV TaxID=1353529 RepID=UPI00038A4237|nr:S8 family serine peptidase [Bacteriovorax sp. BSW11_IV]EQC48200.1 peptidase, S8/S53 family [Bacteriovorax sp. BSW11_IV]